MIRIGILRIIAYFCIWIQNKTFEKFASTGDKFPTLWFIPVKKYVFKVTRPYTIQQLLCMYDQLCRCLGGGVIVGIGPFLLRRQIKCTGIMMDLDLNLLFTLDRTGIWYKASTFVYIFYARERSDRAKLCAFIDIEVLHLRLLLDTHVNHSLLQSFDLYTVFIMRGCRYSERKYSSL